MKKTIFFLLMLFISICFCVHLFTRYTTMEIGEEEAAKIRDELHNLDLLDLTGYETYYKKLYYIIASGEGFSSKVYKDTKGKLTIGYGFNMDRGNYSMEEWNKIFKGLLSFDDAKKGDLQITKEEGQRLKAFAVNRRELELRQIYAPYWDKIRLNERAVLTDLYYQSPELAGKKTRFFSNIKNYYKTGDEKYLERAHNEVKYNSSYSKEPGGRSGLQNRNNIRAIILDSKKCSLYSNPRDELIPKNKKIKIIPGETVISKELSAKFPEGNNFSDYYIWRTKMDGKVRSTHQEMEGKVFNNNDDIVHPGDEYGCRCYRQKLPIHAEIVGNGNTKSEDNDIKYEPPPEIIRKHITDLSEISGFFIR